MADTYVLVVNLLAMAASACLGAWLAYVILERWGADRG